MEDLIMSKLEKIEKVVVEGYQNLAEEQYERTEKAKECKHTHVEIPDSKEIVKKNLEASLNAGKRNIQNQKD